MKVVLEILDVAGRCPGRIAPGGLVQGRDLNRQLIVDLAKRDGAKALVGEAVRVVLVQRYLLLLLAPRAAIPRPTDVGELHENPACKVFLAGLAARRDHVERAQVQYRITDIGAVSDLNPEAVLGSAINDKGRIVGQIFDPSADPTVSAFRWRRGNLIALPGIASISVGAGARAINNRSVIVGFATADDVSDHAVMWRNGQVFDLHDLPGDALFSVAEDINDRGDIVGSGFTGTSSVAVQARDGRIVSLGDLPGGQEASDATAINNRREIVGSGSTDEGERAFLWRNGVMEDLGVLPGAAGGFFFSQANDINDRGEVVGTGNGFNDPFSDTFAFVWREGQMEPLPPLSGHTSAANGINENGDIVGSSEEQAAIWHGGGQPELLRDLVDPNDPDRPFVGLQIARSINESGQIIVWGATRGCRTHARSC